MTEPSCTLHRYHRPRILTVEAHHLVPRAWQKIWQPMGEERELWLPQTMTLCPTGHRAVHHILVEIMKSFAAISTADEDKRLKVAETAVRRRYGNHSEFPVACLAARSWRLKGGLLQTLVNRRAYGYALVAPQSAHLR